MLIGKKIYTKAEFYEFVNAPDNADKTYELIGGEIVQKMPTFGRSSAVSARIMTHVGMYLLKNPIAHLTDAQGGYELDDAHNFAPDVGVILKSRLPELPADDFIRIAPDFVVEVVSQSDLKNPTERIEKKLKKYREVGVPLIWYVFPERKEVEVHKPGQPSVTVGIDGILDGSDVLPNFTLAVNDIFAK